MNSGVGAGSRVRSCGSDAAPLRPCRHGTGRAPQSGGRTAASASLGPEIPARALPEGDPARLTFLGWLERIRSGEITPVVEADAAILAEIDTVRPESFPSRRLTALYLRWACRHVVDNRPAKVTVTTHRASVESVSDSDASAPVVLNSGEVIEAVDSVVYTVGHSESEPDREARELCRFATGHGLVYVSPQPTAAELVRSISPGSNVILRGIGLTAFDTIALLTENRGGTYD